MISDQAIKSIKDIDSLLEFLRDKLDWPIEDEDLETQTYEYYPDELNLDPKYENMISSIRQLRPLVDDQPWGIFFLDFKKKSLPVGAMRKILSGLVFSKRRKTEHAVWDKSELLFVCSLKDEDNLVMGFVHFKDSDSTVPSINTIYWDVNRETNFNFRSKLERLAWPGDMSKTDDWKRTWSSAFTTVYRENIGQSKQLVEKLAELAQNTRKRVLETYIVESSKGALHKLFSKFQELLIHDLSIFNFADMYAQTVAYGLFSARCMDTDGHFELSEVVERIPNTNPFLKQLLKNCFEHGLGNSSSLIFDELAIGEIVDLLDHTDTEKILADWGRQTGSGSEDPVIRFYEGFLDAYEHEQKKRRGVFYTPDPVVRFIVRSVDEILREEFGYAYGLADISTKTLEYQRLSLKQKQGASPKYVADTKEVPAIQILDPAMGTGTFLVHTIRQIKTNFDHKHQGKSADEIKELWNEYVPEHLLPRLNGFELMMAPYAVAHMKLAMVLKETGYEFSGGERINVFLTNSLEEAGNVSMQTSLWEDPLATESIEANRVKCNIGINVVIGNPPYSVTSYNRNEWIQDLIAIYKEGLNERKINLDDDYIKFIRLGQRVVDKDYQGVLAYITNNSFINGVTHRKMRKTLMESFSKIYVINLHGDSNRRETCPDGSKDENVFDIQQGVSISLFVKKMNSKTDCEVYYTDVFGTRDVKNSLLGNSSLMDIGWQQVQPSNPYYFFDSKDYSRSNKYEEGFSVADLFINKNTGIQTKNDELTISFEKGNIQQIVNDFKSLPKMEIEKKYGSKSGTWTIESAKSDLLRNQYTIVPILFRPFDIRYTALTTRSGGFLGRPRYTTMCHMIHSSNVALLVGRQNKSETIDSFLVTNCVSEMKCAERTIQSYHFPLFEVSQTGQGSELIPNLSEPIVEDISNSLGLTFSQNTIIHCEDSFSPLDLFDYIYAVLYSPRYRERYRELLKIDFPRVPYPEDVDNFWKLVKLGEELRKIHLLESPLIEKYVSSYPIAGTNEVVKISYQDEKVWINRKQYFGDVPQLAWEFHVGGYQPAQRWLKERKGRILSSEDIEHYLKIIAVLLETDRLMKEIDEIIV